MSRIVVVDDSAIARKFIKRCLEMSGCEDATFVEAEDGEKALEALKDGPADLVVTDLNMPVMDGAELLMKIKTSPNLTDITVIIITSAENPEKKKELLEQGAYEVLGKPVSPADLFPILEKLSLAGEEA